MKANYPILEFDETRTAILNPDLLLLPEFKPVLGGLPVGCVLCFYLPVLQKMVRIKKLEQVGVLETMNGDLPIYIYESDGTQIVVMHPQVGAPMSAIVMESLIVQGCKKFVILGGGAALVRRAGETCVCILSSAVRDEGLSYHYLPPSREVHADSEGIEILKSLLKRRNIPYSLTKTWTTDGLFRETKQRRAIRVAEGCEVVEMEAAAFYAVADFRGVKAIQLLTTNELILPEGWKVDSWDTTMDTKENLFNISVEAVCEWI
jgi:uridine phosphorylase